MRAVGRVSGLVAAGLGLLVLSGCTSSSPQAEQSSSAAIEVSAADDACNLSADQAPAGALTFAVTNSGSEVTEFYLLGADGAEVVAEVENIGPGLTRTLAVQATPGSYFASCKPGMAGEGIRTAFTVTDGAASAGTKGP